MKKFFFKFEIDKENLSIILNTSLYLLFFQVTYIKGVDFVNELELKYHNDIK